jgi:hypothetical protein
MNDPAPGVRSMAISALTAPSCTTVDAQPLSTELAQKMAAMLEKEVTPERIRAAFEPGHVKDYESGLITIAAETLNHLYRYHARLKSPAEYTAWQRRVLRPLFLAAAGGGTTSESLHACAMDLFTTLIETSLLQEALPVVLQKLDDPALPAQWRLPTLETLWQHPQLGNDKPLNALLLAQLAPRLEALRPRILGPMQDGQDKEQAARLLNEIAEVIQTTRAKLGPQPAEAVKKINPLVPKMGSVCKFLTNLHTLIPSVSKPPRAPLQSPRARTAHAPKTSSSATRCRRAAARSAR